jgi:protein-S-isoprenylcysteine O-methyltransferase Ste14
MVSWAAVVGEVQSGAGGSKGDVAGVIAPPPVLFAGVFLIGFAMQRMHPLGFGPDRQLHLWLKLIFLNGSGALALWASGFMVHARTHINPLRPSTALVTGGPYRFSRNPLSVSLVMLYIGMALQINTVWPIILMPALLWVNHFGIILREERYLESKFGDEYRNYRATVRRWL